MGNYGRFKFDGYTPEYPSEEAMLTDYLNDFRQEVSTELYKDIFNRFLKNDKEALAKYLAIVCAKVNEQRDELKHMKGLKEEIERLRQENYQMQQKLRDVYKSGAGVDLRIRDMYVEEKKSLRKIADVVGMDKNTVKKHLEKMGVYNDRDANAKSLAQHFKFD